LSPGQANKISGAMFIKLLLIVFHPLINTIKENEVLQVQPIIDELMQFACSCMHQANQDLDHPPQALPTGADDNNFSSFAL
jgi:hypothetical protein